MSKFMMLVGVSGCGKSTVAKSLLKEGAIILSSDTIREELWGDAADQQNKGAVFQERTKRAVQALKSGLDVIYDATNLNAKRRTSFLSYLNRNVRNLETECHLVVTEPQRCLDNQFLRERQVPESDVREQLYNFQMPTMSEGWTNPIQVHNPFYREGLLDEMEKAMVGVSQKGPWHQETLDAHNILVTEHAKRMGYSPVVVEMARYHDIGKPFARTIGYNGNTHFFGHASAGAYAYLSAVAPTGPLSYDTWYRAMLIAHHMDFIRKEVNLDVLQQKTGPALYQDLRQLYHADKYGSVRAEHTQMPVLDFMNTFYDWELRLKLSPFCCNIKRDGPYVLLQYQQLNSDFSSRVVQECRGSVFCKDERAVWSCACRPFDKFFNHGQSEAATIDWSTARVLEKIDGCFSGENRVMMADGSEMSFNTIAGKLKTGEELFVLTYNFETGVVEPKRILRIKQTVCEQPENEWLTIRLRRAAALQDCVMTVTRNHVIYVREMDEKIVEKCAEELTVGDRLIGTTGTDLSDGLVVDIQAGCHVQEYRWKFDIEVEDNHNYFCQGVLVHNSLMKMWYHDSEWHLSTNGNIDAFKAAVADLGYSFGDVFNRALGMPYQKLGAWLDPAYTYMFELTSPDTQIVVPYSDGVWYLSRRHTQSGKEEFDRPKLPGVKLPREFHMNKLADVLAVVQAMPKEEEGVVVNDASGNRIKIKSPEYLIASHLANNKMVSNRNLVEYIKEGKIDDFLGYCPQYAPRVEYIQSLIRGKCAEFDAAWAHYRPFATRPRNEFSALIAKDSSKHYLFNKLNNPSLTSEEYVMRLPTPSLMRLLGLKADEQKHLDRESIECDEETR